MVYCTTTMSIERKLFSRRTYPTWLLTTALFLTACGEVISDTTTSSMLETPIELVATTESESAACEGYPHTSVVMYEAASAGAANVEGVMDAANYLVEVCALTEFDRTRTQRFTAADFPRKEMIAMANGEYYTLQYSFDADTRVIAIDLLHERSILPLGSDTRETGLIAQTHLAEVLLDTAPSVVVIDFSASRLAASRYYQRRIIVE